MKTRECAQLWKIIEEISELGGKVIIDDEITVTYKDWHTHGSLDTPLMVLRGSLLYIQYNLD
jgi:hypothetical protein